MRFTGWIKFETREGDTWDEDEGREFAFNRAELGCDIGYINAAEEVWFSFAASMWGVADHPTLPSGFTARNLFQVFNKYANLQLHSLATGIELWTYHQETDADPIVKTTRYVGPPMVDGQTERFLLRCEFSPNAGQLQVWRNGVEICNLYGLAMGYTGTNWARPKFGIYRLASKVTVRQEYAYFKFGPNLSGHIAAPPPLPSNGNQAGALTALVADVGDEPRGRSCSHIICCLSVHPLAFSFPASDWLGYSMATPSGRSVVPR